ncbi:hypothetical protein GC169_04225 [bacterium]|nr:hypothetical protein [bacterium]
MSRARPDPRGFVLIDALVALIVASSVLAALYGLISASARSTTAARATALAAGAVEQACLTAARAGDATPGTLSAVDADRPVTIRMAPEQRPSLPVGLRLWRIDCSAPTGPAGRVFSVSTYALLADAAPPPTDGARGDAAAAPPETGRFPVSPEPETGRAAP